MEPQIVLNNESDQISAENRPLLVEGIANNDYQGHERASSITSLPDLNRETCEAEIRLINNFIAMSPAEKNDPFNKDEMLQLVHRVEHYQNNEIVRKDLKIENLKQLIRNGGKSMAQVSANNQSKEQMDELTWLLEELTKWLNKEAVMQPDSRNAKGDFIVPIIDVGQQSNNEVEESKIWQCISKFCPGNQRRERSPDYSSSKTTIGIIVGVIFTVWSCYEVYNFFTSPSSSGAAHSWTFPPHVTDT